jgi:hypothetical protein
MMGDALDNDIGRHRTISRATALAALLIMLMPAIHAISPACDTAMSFQLSNWKSLVAITVTISFSLIGLIYMFGKMMSNERLINMAKTDIQQTVITVVIVYALFMPFVMGICSLNLSSLGLPSDSTLFDASRQYFEYSRQLAMNKYTEAMSSAVLVGVVSSIYVGQGFSINMQSVSFSPFAGISVLSSITSSIMNWLLLNIAVADAQRALVDVIQTSFLNLLLPTGVLLRAFSPTRSVGGILISRSLGLFLIHPLVFGLLYVMIGAPTTAPQGPKDNSLLLGSYILSISGFVALANMFKLGSLLIGPAMLTTIWPIVTFNTINTVVNTMGGLGEVIFRVLVLPGLAWIYITAFVRDISKLMGEEIDISGLSRMI